MKKKPSKKKWIQKTGVQKNKGGLHRALGVPQGQTIPASKLMEALHSRSPHLRRMASFAKAMKSIRNKK